jgi:uncharacterized lipoprotein YajG
MNKISGKFVVVMALAFLAGCATQSTTWVKRKVSPIQSAKDLKLCSEKAGLMFNLTGKKGGPVATISQDSYSNYAGEPFEKCMNKKGYRKEKN